MDSTAINYNPFANTDTAGFNPGASMSYQEMEDGTISTTTSSYYDGNCIYWIYGCMDPTALNYAGPGNIAGAVGEDGEAVALSPPANTQYNQSYEILSQEDWENPNLANFAIYWTPGPNVSPQQIESGEAVECETCGCEYIGDGNLQLQVRNYPGDSEASEEDVDYNNYDFDDTEG